MLDVANVILKIIQLGRITSTNLQSVNFRLYHVAFLDPIAALKPNVIHYLETLINLVNLSVMTRAVMVITDEKIIPSWEVPAA